MCVWKNEKQKTRENGRTTAGAVWDKENDKVYDYIWVTGFAAISSTTTAIENGHSQFL